LVSGSLVSFIGPATVMAFDQFAPPFVDEM
jgi:hypothetical protein